MDLNTETSFSSTSQPVCLGQKQSLSCADRVVCEPLSIAIFPSGQGEIGMLKQLQAAGQAL